MMHPSRFAGKQGDQFLLWVDGVGGYLVCLQDEVSLGQASYENDVDVPILGDLSRRHAALRRDGGQYIIEPRVPLLVNGRRTESPRLLAHGDELALGSVRIEFRQPHPLSGTARLEIVSHHKPQPAADAILLMDQTCLLGPAPRNHIVCRDWPREVVIYRRAGQYYCRAPGEFRIDGRAVRDAGPITLNSRIEGETFCLSLESPSG